MLHKAGMPNPHPKPSPNPSPSPNPNPNPTLTHSPSPNPDPNQAVMPNHAQWAHVLGALRYVVVDEAHMYRGVFGCHVALILRRLRRLAALYGAAPRFVCCSATVGNPRHLFTELTGLDEALLL